MKTTRFFICFIRNFVKKTQTPSFLRSTFLLVQVLALYANFPYLMMMPVDHFIHFTEDTFHSAQQINQPRAMSLVSAGVSSV